MLTSLRFTSLPAYNFEYFAQMKWFSTLNKTEIFPAPQLPASNKLYVLAIGQYFKFDDIASTRVIRF